MSNYTEEELAVMIAEADGDVIFVDGPTARAAPAAPPSSEGVPF